jgi:hypothetical protein
MRRVIVTLACIAVIALGVPGVAVAASPHTVDPATMTPALNPDYNPWVCTDTGAGPICRGHLAGAWSNEELPFGCGARPLFTTGSFSSDGTRWHLPDGRATHTFFQNASTERWTLSSTGAGLAVTVRSAWIEHFVYGIPGDLDTRVRTITGADWQVTATGLGVVWHDVGMVRFEPGIDTPIDLMHGPHDSNHGDLDLVLPAVCAALGA